MFIIQLALQRDVVFNHVKKKLKCIAVDGVKLVKELSRESDGRRT